MSALENTLQNVISELHAIWPERNLETYIELPAPVYCDSNRIGQLFSNQLSNALTHGNKDQPVRISATMDDSDFVLSVSNPATEIPSIILERLFLPYSRGNSKDINQGLGLGLYIASEIANAHQGTLSVISTPEETVSHL